MESNTAPCGCCYVRAELDPRRTVVALCAAHAIGPAALGLLYRIEAAEGIVQTLADAPELPDETPGSTLVRELALVVSAHRALRLNGTLPDAVYARLRQLERAVPRSDEPGLRPPNASEKGGA